MKESRLPAWCDDARWYYSRVETESLIGTEFIQSVSVFHATGYDEVNDESPGTLRLRSERQFLGSPWLRVLDAGGHAAGVIRSEGLVPGMRYAMRGDGNLGWRLSVRSIVRKHYALELHGGDSWTIDTPFFWWQQLTGTALGVPRLLGGLGPHWSIWTMAIEPGRDTLELLAAVAFLHRQWSRW